MAEFKKVTKTNHKPKRGDNNQFLVYSTQFNEMVDALNDGTGDLNVNDAVVTGDLTVTGTSTFNGAIVLGDAAADALTINATVTQGAPVNYSNATTITAFATGGQASATALTEEINNVTTVATAGDSVKLPAAVAGMHIYVKNSGATALDIFPATSDSIDALAVNLAIRIQPGSSIDFYAKDATVWESNLDNSITLNSPTTVTGQLEIKAAASAGNTVTTITNASQAGARTYTVPDAGASASFVMTEGAQTLNGVKTFGDTTASTTKDTGGLITQGGVGVEKEIYAGLSINAGTYLTSGNGTVSLPAIGPVSDPDSGLYVIGANNLGVACAGAKVLDIATTGLGVTGTLSATGVTTLVGVSQAPVFVADATPYTVLAADSGKTHIILEQTASITLNLPVIAAGLYYKFILGGVATEAQNWIIVATTPSFYNGGVVWLDLNEATDNVAVVYGDGTSHLTFTAVTPAIGTCIEIYSNGTEWFMSGTVVSDTTPTMA